MSEIEEAIKKGICPACNYRIDLHSIITIRHKKRIWKYIEVQLPKNEEFQCCALNSPLARAMFPNKEAKK